ncbi:Uncharacterised protein [Slackia heliotrinireducens]|uniref:Uncharacterized protein n=1 Tax=Slackia heliotrinireducens (strain ATCC 29202 / DSM 20476 / NCTC 11029 / RHS 1) TaxID=471855 RepID=C7N6Q1_SLAHD|nr:hypothetical protein [Slackia heliotrinireducens]ACV22586.1 hypothetical protein Shel_15670 [Slackia heliotrinireducens DSM 20476]VEH01081.1 Uncharacterised protein [Slackia heliotrinireducens]
MASRVNVTAKATGGAAGLGCLAAIAAFCGLGVAVALVGMWKLLLWLLAL